MGRSCWHWVPLLYFACVRGELHWLLPLLLLLLQLPHLGGSTACKGRVGAMEEEEEEEEEQDEEAGQK